MGFCACLAAWSRAVVGWELGRGFLTSFVGLVVFVWPGELRVENLSGWWGFNMRWGGPIWVCYRLVFSLFCVLISFLNVLLMFHVVDQRLFTHGMFTASLCLKLAVSRNF